MLGDAGGGAPFRPGILHAVEGDGAEPGLGWLFPDVALETWRENVFQLAWHQHGGSGLAVSMGDALDLAVADRDWLNERIGVEREREARALERAAKRK